MDPRLCREKNQVCGVIERGVGPFAVGMAFLSVRRGRMHAARARLPREPVFTLRRRLANINYLKNHRFGGVKTPPYKPGQTTGFPANLAHRAPLPGRIYAAPTNHPATAGNRVWRALVLPGPANRRERATSANTMRYKENRLLPCRAGGLGDPYGNRTHVTAVKGPCLNLLTNGPYRIQDFAKTASFQPATIATGPPSFSETLYTGSGNWI